jgi:hypothetical protein
MSTYAQTGAWLLEDMIVATQGIKGFTAEITKTERIDGEYITQITAVKLQRSPFNAYLRQRFPDDGVEVLMRADKNKALINTNSFPWMNLHLDPFGSLMRRNQHHTVFDSGFDLMASLLSQQLSAVGKDTTEYLQYFGTKTYDGRQVYHIEFTNPDYAIKSYTVQGDESVIDIAKKLNINEYYILEINEDVDFYDDVKPNQVINVTTHYSKTMTLYIDTEYLMPFVIWTYDNDGLYEKYAYSKFILNPDFSPNEFEPDFEDYDF